MRVVATDGPLDVGQVQRTVRLTRQGMRMNAAQSRRTALLVQEDVVHAADDQLVAAAAVGQDADQVAHGATGYEDGRFLAQDLGRHRFQAVDGRILAVDVVAQRGAGHRLSHGGSRHGHRVGPHVDDGLSVDFGHVSILARVWSIQLLRRPLVLGIPDRLPSLRVA